MKKLKTVHTPQDVRGIIFMTEYVNAKYFHGEDMGTVEYQEIESIINDGYSSDIKESTIRRICTFRTNPTRISYKRLNIFTRWCFEDDGNYDSFKKYLDSRENEINENTISDKEVEDILNILHKRNVPVYISHDVNIDLGNIPVSFNLGEGFVAKLIDEVSIVTGDLISKKIKENPMQFGISSNQRIDNRIGLMENRRQLNIENIVAKAIEFARKKEASDDIVDQDWIVEFFNIAQDCSDENMQYLWAKLLAGEVHEPYSFSRRTLGTIKLLNPIEAKVFTQLCCCIWDLEEAHFGREKVLIKDMDSNGRYSDETWGFNGSFISHLEEVGLVYDSFLQLDNKRTYNAAFFGKGHKLKTKIKEQQIDIVALTQVGVEIFNIVNPKSNNNYYIATLKYFEDINILKK